MRRARAAITSCFTPCSKRRLIMGDYNSRTSRQLCVDSRTQFPIARKCFWTRSLTPIITKAQSFMSSVRRPLSRLHRRSPSDPDLGESCAKRSIHRPIAVSARATYCPTAHRHPGDQHFQCALHLATGCAFQVHPWQGRFQRSRLAHIRRYQCGSEGDSLAIFGPHLRNFHCDRPTASLDIAVRVTAVANNCCTTRP